MLLQNIRLLVHSQGLCIEWRIFNLEAIVAIHCRLAISKGGRFDQGGG